MKTVVFSKCSPCGHGVPNVVPTRASGVPSIHCNDEVEAEAFVDLEVTSGSIYTAKTMQGAKTRDLVEPILARGSETHPITKLFV